ncbi:hypothetical protein ACIBG0_10510 [Nocardia sp. NPDC050630]|uniref:hypothetical protein n=1 Tax=Nocardia sp. NPDC050630 TaxID=3364321 RepID=UPI0037AC02AA
MAEWLVVAVTASTTICASLGAQALAAFATSKREIVHRAQEQRARSRSERLEAYGKLLTSAAAALQELKVWAWYLVVDEGREPNAQRVQELLDETRDHVSIVDLIGSTVVADSGRVLAQSLGALEDGIWWRDTMAHDDEEAGALLEAAASALSEFQRSARADVDAHSYDEGGTTITKMRWWPWRLHRPIV